MKQEHDPSSHILSGKQVATLGGGCFWCLEAVFEQLKGVEHVASGYAGGGVPNPSYKQVCAGATGHAEVVHVTFDPQAISLKDILEVFFSTHDPTTLNRQGADVGTQYRSAVFYHNLEQKAMTEQVIEEITADGLWEAPIVTEITPFEAFYEAEDYHQGYFARNRAVPYCEAVIAPKLAKFRKRWAERLKKSAVTG